MEGFEPSMVAHGLLRTAPMPDSGTPALWIRRDLNSQDLRSERNTSAVASLIRCGHGEI